MAHSGYFTLRLILNGLYIVLHVLFFAVIAQVSYRFVMERKKQSVEAVAGRNRQSTLLFYTVLSFNLVTFLSVAGLLFMAVLHFLMQFPLTDLRVNIERVYNGYHSIFVLFYGKQNCLMLLVLYFRVKFIFQRTAMRLSNCTNRIFMAGFAFALTLFVSLPILHAVSPDISIWTWCSSTFCFYNVIFMVSLSCLFLYKLVMTHKLGASLSDEETQQKILFLITKTSILAITSIGCTMLSCVLLIARFTFHSSNEVVIGVSNCMIVIDIYGNFLFITLCFKVFDSYYKKLCGAVHPFCARWWNARLTKTGADRKLSHETADRSKAICIELPSQVRAESVVSSSTTTELGPARTESVVSTSAVPVPEETSTV